jgi:flagellar biosynthesis/type III secretory pathway protein FliH
LFNRSGPDAPQNTSQTWAPISATNFACFTELEDGFDGLHRSPKNQTSSGESSSKKQDTNDRLEQELVQQKQIELVRFTERLNALEEKCISEIRDHERVLAQRLLDLAIRLAEKVVLTHFAVDKSALLPLVEEALAQILPGDNNVKLSIHPDDAELISQTFSDELKEKRLTFVADAGLSLGSCQIQSDYSVVDNSLVMRWEQMIRETGLNESARTMPSFRPSKTSDLEAV